VKKYWNGKCIAVCQNASGPGGNSAAAQYRRVLDGVRSAVVVAAHAVDVVVCSDAAGPRVITIEGHALKGPRVGSSAAARYLSVSLEGRSSYAVARLAVDVVACRDAAVVVYWVGKGHGAGGPCGGGAAADGYRCILDILGFSGRIP